MNNFYKAGYLLSKKRSLKPDKLTNPLKGIEEHKTAISEKEALTKSGLLESYTQYLASLIFNLQFDKIIQCDIENHIEESIAKIAKGNRSKILRSTYKRNKCGEKLLSIALPFLLVAVINLLGITKVTGQQRNDIKNVSLKVGDTIPEEIWTKVNKVINMQNQDSTLMLNNYKHKDLIVLDFWTSWCSSCIKSFSKLNSLQRELSNKIQILLINPSSSKDDARRIDYIINKQVENISEGFIVPTLYQDEVFTNLFKPKIYPHLIWINSSGRILDITGSRELTKDAIISFLQLEGGGDE